MRLSSRAVILAHDDYVRSYYLTCRVVYFLSEESWMNLVGKNNPAGSKVFAKKCWPLNAKLWIPHDATIA